MTDWLAILEEQTATGETMAREVPDMLGNPDISERQVRTLFSALETQAAANFTASRVVGLIVAAST